MLHSTIINTLKYQQYSSHRYDPTLADGVTWHLSILFITIRSTEYTNIIINFSDLSGGRDKSSGLLHVGLEKLFKLWRHT